MSIAEMDGYGHNFRQEFRNGLGHGQAIFEISDMDTGMPEKIACPSISGLLNIFYIISYM